jgi:phosphatidylserine/phosphatidylglycerophosphate/cardiolipin synthase-like enzyme
MHHKFMIRDSRVVWTGSTNWTDDAWTRQENVIIVVDSPDLATAFHREFEELVGAGTVAETGRIPPEWHDGIRAWFTPGHGEDLSHRMSQAIGRASRRVRICSPVLTTPPVLGALAGAIEAGRVDIAGCMDGPQIKDAVRQWRQSRGSWKVPLLELIAGRFSAKASTPYGAGDVHDFMHAKVTVVDDTVFLGSFNLSRSGERNAENVLELEDPDLAERMSEFVDAVRLRYAPLVL